MVLSETYQSVVDRFTNELGAFHIGRATPSIVEEIIVDYYGTMTPLKQLASIQAPEAKVLIIQPFDQNTTKAIEQAIQKSDLGVQPNNEGKQIRIVLPPVTDERRQQLVKSLNQKTEEVRVRIRQERDKEVKGIRKREKDGEISEDDRFTEEKELQEQVDDAIKQVESIAKEKEEAIAHV